MGKTGYFTHPDCRRHEMGPGHPECPERLDAIEDRLLVTGVGDALERRDAPMATVDNIILAHARRHVESIDELRTRLASHIAAGGRGYAQIDPDTSLNGSSWDATMRASGAVIAAVHAGMAGQRENAVCPVRPEPTPS